MVNLIAALLGIGGRTLGSYFEERKIRTQARLDIERIKIEGEVTAARTLAQTVADYDNIAQRNMKYTWKDEYLLIMWTFPMNVSFLTPFIALTTDVDLTPQLAAAWQLIGQTPVWYQVIMGGIVAATFGLRWLFRRNPKALWSEEKSDGHPKVQRTPGVAAQQHSVVDRVPETPDRDAHGGFDTGG